MPERKQPVSWLISAEHAGNEVPARWQHLFADRRALLDSHRGWDPGSAELARALSGRLDAPLLAGRITRLLIDLNRSASHPHRFSEYSKKLAPTDRNHLVRDYWQPHWIGYRHYLDTLPGRIIHIACHSFTPVLDGQRRSTDIGLLYDPSRAVEAEFCRAFGERLRQSLPDLRVHMNRPYRGISNGMGQQHRRLYPDARLITFELEINQRLMACRYWSGLPALIAGELCNSLGCL